MTDTNHTILQLIDENTSKILKILINNSDKDFNLRELAREAKVPVASTHRILNKLCKMQMVGKIEINKFKVYKFNPTEKNKQLSSIFEIKKPAMEQFVDYVKQLNEVEEVIQQGDVADKKANVLIIGNKIDAKMIDSFVEEIKLKNDFEISFVALDQNQFRKMTSMGLYSGKKLNLFSRI